MTSAVRARLTAVPWSALRGLANVLEPALNDILSGTPAERVVDRTLRAHRDFTAEQRLVVAESLFGVGLWRRRLRTQTSSAASSLTLLAALATDLGGAPDAAAHLGAEPFSLAPLTDWRDEHSLPDWLAAELEAAVGVAEAPLLANALNSPGAVCLRPNLARTSSASLQSSLAADGISVRPGAWVPDALVVTSPRPNLLGSKASQQGLFEVQDEGSQLVGALLPLAGCTTVLDLCAGAGGKTLQLAARGGPSLRVHAYDLDGSKLERLRQRASRSGATVSIHHQLPDGPFDAVLVDAPCSELGALRRGPDLRWRLQPSTFDGWCETNGALLDSAFQRVRVGGHIAYVTCTFRRSENEGVVDTFLQRNRGAKRVPALAPASARTPLGDVALFPHRQGTDGFYAALLERTA